MKCIICEVDNVHYMPLNDGIKDDNEENAIFSEEKATQGNGHRWDNANSKMWNGGIVQIIDAGYGSNHDTDRYVIAICDECITKKEQEGVLLYHSNYMTPSMGEEPREKSKLLYRRSKNIDRLTN